MCYGVNKSLGPLSYGERNYIFDKTREAYSTKIYDL